MFIADNVIMENINIAMFTLVVLKTNQQLQTPAIVLAKEEIAKGISIIPAPKSTDD